MKWNERVECESIVLVHAVRFRAHNAFPISALPGFGRMARIRGGRCVQYRTTRNPYHQ